MSDEIWNAYNNFKVMEADLILLSKYIDIDPNNYKTTSAEIRKIILSSCALLEQAYIFLLEDLNEPSSENGSIAAQILAVTEKNKCPLSNLTPKIQDKIFEPWKKAGLTNEGFYRFMWWDAYNACKHNKKDDCIKEIEFFRAALESVAALFTITVFLTSKTQTNFFWHLSDYIKIRTPQTPHHQTYYMNIKSLRKQIWPDFVEKKST